METTKLITEKNSNDFPKKGLLETYFFDPRVTYLPRARAIIKMNLTSLNSMELHSVITEFSLATSLFHHQTSSMS